MQVDGHRQARTSSMTISMLGNQRLAAESAEKQKEGGDKAPACRKRGRDGRDGREGRDGQQFSMQKGMIMTVPNTSQRMPMPTNRLRKPMEKSVPQIIQALSLGVRLCRSRCLMQQACAKANMMQGQPMMQTSSRNAIK